MSLMGILQPWLISVWHCWMWSCESDTHNWLADSAGPNLILNTCHTTEKKGMPVSTRGKKSEWQQQKRVDLPSTLQLQAGGSCSRRREREKKQEEGGGERKRFRAATKPFSLTPQVLWEANVRKEIVPIDHDLFPLESSILRIQPTYRYSPIRSVLWEKNKEALVGVEETGFTHSSGIQWDCLKS